jgi:hypothetical protein
MKRMYLIALLVAGCMDEGKGPEEELLDDDGKADSIQSPTYHGSIIFDIRESSALTTERYHAWTFELSGEADIVANTSYALLGQRRTDTVLYLHKLQPTGRWGAYIARNDDYGNTTYSKISKKLDAGRYRVLVKGHAASTTGKFSIGVTCSGAGCAPPAPECLFGWSYNDLYTIPNLVTNKIKIYPNTLNTLTAADQHKLMRAVQQSSHSDVTTPLEALMRVDQEEMNVIFIDDVNARRQFIAFEYGAGDNSYGAFFDRRGPEMVSKIHDGDLEACTARAETCLLPEDWSALRASPDYMRTATKVVVAGTTLTTLETQQALGAFHESFPEVTTVAQGLTMVDDNELGIHTYRHTSGKEITVAEYHAGDTSVGAIYYAGTTNLAGAINDLFIEACTFFAP